MWQRQIQCRPTLRASATKWRIARACGSWITTKSYWWLSDSALLRQTLS